MAITISHSPQCDILKYLVLSDQQSTPKEIQFTITKKSFKSSLLRS